MTAETQKKPKRIRTYKRDKTNCSICGKPEIVAFATADANWALCSKGVKSAAANAFFPRTRKTGVILTPEMSL